MTIPSSSSASPICPTLQHRSAVGPPIGSSWSVQESFSFVAGGAEAILMQSVEARYTKAHVEHQCKYMPSCAGASQGAVPHYKPSDAQCPHNLRRSQQKARLATFSSSSTPNTRSNRQAVQSLCSTSSHTRLPLLLSTRHLQTGLSRLDPASPIRRVRRHTTSSTPSRNPSFAIAARREPRNEAALGFSRILGTPALQIAPLNTP